MTRKLFLVFTVLVTLLGVTVLTASAAYTGPLNRTVTTTTWSRQRCTYQATVASPYGTCTLTLYDSSCPGASGLGGYFSPGPLACGSSWPGTCGSTISCTIVQTGSSTVGCSSGDTGCTSSTSSTTYQPASVSGTVNCAVPGSGGWCRGGATLTLSGADTYPGASITGFENPSGTLCSGSSCTWDFPEGATVDMPYWSVSSHNDTSYQAFTTMYLDSAPPALSISANAPDGVGGWYLSPATLSAIASDAVSGVASVAYQVDRGGWTSASSVTVSDSGVHTVEFQVLDVAGNVTAGSQTVSIDTVPPQSVFADPPEGSSTVVRGVFTMSGQTTDSLSGPAGAAISLDGGASWQLLPIASGAWSFTWDTAHVSNGPHVILVSGADEAGNQEHTARITLVVSNQPPSVGITPEWTVFGRADVTIQAGSSPVAGAIITVSDPEGRWPDAVFGYSPGELPSGFSWPGRMGDGSTAWAGKYRVTVRAWDDYGNSAEAVGWVVIHPAPTAVPTDAPQPAAVQPAADTPRPANTPVPAPALPTAVPTVAPAPQPSPVPRIVAILLWPVVGLVGMLTVLAAAGVSDGRPRSIGRLAATLDAVFSSHEDQSQE